MSSYYHHAERREERYSQNAAPSIRVGSWMGGPASIVPPPIIPPPIVSSSIIPPPIVSSSIIPPLNVFTPAVYGGPLLGNVGSSSGYSYESYSSPGYSYHYERMY